MSAVLAIIFVLALGAIYIFIYKQNQKIEKPEGTKELDCSGCSVDNCSQRKE